MNDFLFGNMKKFSFPSKGDTSNVYNKTSSKFKNICNKFWPKNVEIPNFEDTGPFICNQLLNAVKNASNFCNVYNDFKRGINRIFMNICKFMDICKFIISCMVCMLSILIILRFALPVRIPHVVSFSPIFCNIISTIKAFCCEIFSTFTTLELRKGEIFITALSLYGKTITTQSYGMLPDINNNPYDTPILVECATTMCGILHADMVMVLVYNQSLPNKECVRIPTTGSLPRTNNFEYDEFIGVKFPYYKDDYEVCIHNITSAAVPTMDSNRYRIIAKTPEDESTLCTKYV